MQLVSGGQLTATDGASEAVDVEELVPGSANQLVGSQRPTAAAALRCVAPSDLVTFRLFKRYLDEISTQWPISQSRM